MSNKKVETAVRYLVDFGPKKRSVLRNQVQLCKRESSAKGIAVVEEFIDSSENMHRPRLTDAVEYCIKHGIDYLLIPSDACIGGSQIHLDCKHANIIDQGVDPIILSDDEALGITSNEYAGT